MTTAATTPPSTWRGDPIEFTFAVLGLVVALLTLPFVLVAGGPLNGWVLGVVLFAAYWIGGIVIGKFTLGMSPTHAVGVAGIAFVARVWIVFGTLLLVAFRAREVGVTAMLVFAVAFTFDMIGRVVLHSLRQKAADRTAKP